MLADPNQPLNLLKLFLQRSDISLLEPLVVSYPVEHDILTVGQIEVFDVAPKPLKKWVIFEILIELVTPYFPFEQDVLRVLLGIFLLKLVMQGIREKPLACPKLNEYVLKTQQFVLFGKICELAALQGMTVLFLDVKMLLHQVDVVVGSLWIGRKCLEEHPR